MSQSCPKCGIYNGRHRPRCPYAAYTLPGVDPRLAPYRSVWTMLRDLFGFDKERF